MNTDTIWGISIITKKNFWKAMSLISIVTKVLTFWTCRKNREGSPSGAEAKTLPANAGDARDAGSVPRLGRSPGEGNGSLLQYSCLGNSKDRGPWWVTVHGAAKRWTGLMHVSAERTGRKAQRSPLAVTWKSHLPLCSSISSFVRRGLFIVYAYYIITSDKWEQFNSL